MCATFAHAQKGKFIKTDTIKVQQIEDINLHKTGNPNKAKPLSTKSNLTVMETPQPIAIVTHEIIEQQQAKQLSDVLQNVNGIYVTSSREILRIVLEEEVSALETIIFIKTEPE